MKRLHNDSGFKHLIEHIQDAVVAFELIDNEPIIRDVNEAFVTTFGYSRETVLDRSLNQYIVPQWLEHEAEALDLQTKSGDINYRHVRRQTAEGLRTFLYRGVPYEDSERIDGYAVYTDLTDSVRKDQQLQVLHRVLRHNLRNEITILIGNVNRLLDRYEGDQTDQIVADTRKAAENLRTLTKEATQINKILTSEWNETRTVDSVSLVQHSVKRFRQHYPSVTIETKLPDSMPVMATAKLRAAINSLLANAIEHNSSHDPRVVISIQSVEGDEEAWIDILVNDNGTTIPDTEKAVITGNVDISPLEHGSGLGLWLVKWTVEEFGGSLLFGENELGGNSIRVRLPRGNHGTQ